MTASPAAGQARDDLLLRVLGDELRNLRLAHGWTRKLLNQRLTAHTGTEVSLQTLAAYEHGTRAMTVTRLYELCAVLDERPPPCWPP